MLLLDAGFLWAIASRPLPLIDNLTIPDDAYLSLQLARNIAQGHGPLYGLDATNGFQPLYVFLMVPAFRLWPNDLETPIQVALLMLSVFNLGTLFILFRLTQRLTGSALVALFVGLAWISNFAVAYNTLNGLETAVAVFFVAASLSAFQKLVEAPTLELRGAAWLGLLLGLAVLARIDALILAAVLGATLFLRHRRQAGLFKALGLLAVVVGLVTLPWWLYSLHYTGMIFPVSGPAVRFRSLANVSHAPTLENFYGPMAMKAVSAVWQKNQEIICGVGVLLVLRLSTRQRIGHSWFVAALVAYAVTMLIAYATYVVAAWYFSRYLFPLILILLLLFALEARALSEGSSAWRGVAAMVGLVVLGSQLSRPQFHRLFTSTETNVFGYMNLGLWARDQFPPGTRIGSSQSGALGYFAPELTVVNLDGVVNQRAFAALREQRGIPYVRENGLQYLVNWERDVQFLLAHSPPEEVQHVVDLGPVPGFRSWNNIWHVYQVQP